MGKTTQRAAFAAFVLVIAALCGGPRPVASEARPEARSRGTATDQRKWGTPVDGLALSIATDKPEYAPVEVVILRIAFKNVGKAEKDIGVPNTLDAHLPRQSGPGEWQGMPPDRVREAELRRRPDRGF